MNEAIFRDSSFVLTLINVASTKEVLLCVD